MDNEENKDLVFTKNFSNNFISRKRNRNKNTFDKSINHINGDYSNNIKEKKLSISKNDFIDLDNNDQNDIEEETKDNSNNNRITNNYNKHLNKSIFNSNYFENMNGLSNLSFNLSINDNFSEEEKLFLCQPYKNETKKSSNCHLKNNNSFNFNKQKKKTQNEKCVNLISEFCNVNRHFKSKNKKSNKNDIEDDSNLYCILCSWRYPNEMDFKDKNEHINLCMDGKGEQHKKAWASSQRLINIAINQEDEKNLNGDNSSYKNRNSKDILGNYCSLCEKKIYYRNGKTINDHILECYKQKEEEMFKKTQKNNSS